MHIVWFNEKDEASSMIVNDEIVYDFPYVKDGPYVIAVFVRDIRGWFVNDVDNSVTFTAKSFVVMKEEPSESR